MTDDTLDVCGAGFQLTDEGGGYWIVVCVDDPGHDGYHTAAVFWPVDSESPSD